MAKRIGLIGSVCALLVSSGCISPATTRMPDILQGRLPREHASSQRTGFELNDPLASDDLGPYTDTRPRSYYQQRTIPRRAAENYFSPQFGEISPEASRRAAQDRTTEFPATVETQ